MERIGCIKTLCTVFELRLVDSGASTRILLITDSLLFVGCGKEAVILFFSDQIGIVTVPAALESPDTPSHKSGTRYIESVAKGASTPWDPETNPDNPFGVFLLKIGDENGENAHKHMHGTTSGLPGVNIVF